jgi:hypothetical protein
MRNHNNPFSALNHLEFFKNIVIEDGRNLLEPLFDELSYSNFRNRIFSPLTTLWLFVIQVLNADQSCRQILSQFLVSRVKNGERLCSLRTGGYCRARGRLSEEMIKGIVRNLGSRLQEKQNAKWLWKNRQVKVVDGTSVTMPDTEENQAQYPQPHRRAGLGFPQARVLVVFSLATGALLEAVVSKLRGDQTGEVSLFRSVHNTLQKFDLLLFDRLYTSYVDMDYFIQNQIDFVGTLFGARILRDCRICRLTKNDHLIYLEKPKKSAVRHFTYESLQDYIIVRLVNVAVNQRGFRTRKLRVVTSLLDEKEYSAEDIAQLYRQRWQAELDIRKVKTVMHMDVLRCRTPEMIRKEIWAHLLAYNLTCALLAETANRCQSPPTTLSFTATLQLFRSIAIELSDELFDNELLGRLLDQLITENVGHRPDRYEPRALKRRNKNYPLLLQNRSDARAKLSAA